MRVFYFELLHVIDGFDQIHTGITLPHRAFNFRMSLMPNHDDLAIFISHFGHLDMHLGHQWAGRIEYE